METRLAAMEKFVEKLINEMDVLCEENQALKNNFQKSAH